MHAWTGDFEQAEARLAAARPQVERAGSWRERLHLRQSEAGLHDARDDVAAAAVVYAEVVQEFQDCDMGLYAALAAVRLGGLHLRLDDLEAASTQLRWALEVAERGAVATVAAEARVWLECLPDGSLEAARVLLERDAAWLPACAGIRLRLELARRFDDEPLRAEARAHAERVLSTAPAGVGERMRAGVALYRDALR